MLQIIGWIGCLYLVIKALEIASNPVFRNENGMLKNMAMTACLLAWSGALIFALWLGAQGSAFPAAETSTEQSALEASIKGQCIELATTPEAILKCAE